MPAKLVAGLLAVVAGILLIGAASADAAMVPLVGTWATSPDLPVTPRVASRGRSLRPYAFATSAPPSASSGPFAVCVTPTTTASHRVLAGLALRRMYDVTGAG